MSDPHEDGPLLGMGGHTNWKTRAPDDELPAEEPTEQWHQISDGELRRLHYERKQMWWAIWKLRQAHLGASGPRGEAWDAAWSKLLATFSKASRP